MNDNPLLQQLEGVLVGQASDPLGLTGCTVVVFPQGAVAGHVAVGMASGSRELEALTPRHRVEQIQAICLAGGSAFGLAAASGVARTLEVAGIGHVTSFGKVPIVASAVVYDLNLGDPRARPDESMGQQAAEAALAGAPLSSGNVGAGTGTCAGKVLGPACATKTGLGLGGVANRDGLVVAALAVVNPVGDVLEPTSGQILAGTRVSPRSPRLLGTSDLLRSGHLWEPPPPNTVLCLVATNAALSRIEARWVAEQATVALARCIDPPFTRHDGDVVFCASVGELPIDIHLVGLLARDALQEALLDACRAACPAGGLPSSATLLQPEHA